jgi:alpha-L-rhamnosidase
MKTPLHYALIVAALLFASQSVGASDETSTWERVVTHVARLPLDGNIQPLYEIEKAAWVWAEDAGVDEKLVLEFENKFEIEEATEVVVHVTADQRYELFIDGELMSLGPDRSDVNHWAFATYRLRLPAGTHRLTATVAWIGDDAPCAQITHRGGFLFAAEGPLASQLNTGVGEWTARRVEGWSFAPGAGPDFVGREQMIAVGKGDHVRMAPLAVVSPPLDGNAFGLMRTGWRLHPSPLPDQKLEPLTLGTVRAVVEGSLPSPPVIRADDCESDQRGAWQQLARGDSEVVVPSNSQVSVLFDLENYCTAYPRMTLEGGRGSSAQVTWAESLYELEADGSVSPRKGHRDDVAGKAFRGVDDDFITLGGEQFFKTWWWRAGRYVLLTVNTADEPLTIKKFDLLQSRYPLEDEGSFASSDDKLDRTQGLMVRGMQMCAHETYMDCPYYEQLMYVGDTRVELLTTYAMTADTRLPKRGIELYDWSMSLWGMAAEHYPSRTPQLSPTFGLIWVSMVRDFTYWRDDPAWVRERLPAMRGTIDRFLVQLEDDGLLGPQPGWPFVDWVDGWMIGIPPGGKEGKSSIVNLHLVQALLAAADVEEAHGEAALAARNREEARRLGDRIVERFWVADRQLLADDLAHQNFSEHAQCLAILSGVLSEDQEAKCLEAMLAASDLKRCTIYFSFYLFEALAKHGRGDEIVKRWELWKSLEELGLKTPIESPEPTRSDCHAWGSHPLFHARASLFGVRPASPGFATVLIEPRPGDLTEMSVRVPHPKGEITGELSFDSAKGGCRGTITLPEAVTGEFRYHGRTIPLSAGRATAISTD